MENISDEQLNVVYRIIGGIVRDRGEKYLPIFKRVHDEVEKRKASKDLLILALQTASEPL